MTAHPPDFGDEDPALFLLYEAHSESNAMYNDEFKANFHELYMKEKGVHVSSPTTGRPRAVCLAPETIDVLKKWKTEQLRT